MITYQRIGLSSRHVSLFVSCRGTLCNPLFELADFRLCGLSGARLKNPYGRHLFGANLLKHQTLFRIAGI